MTTRKTRRAGDVERWDGQSDAWRGAYRLVERTAPNTWLVERLADDDAVVDAIVAYYAEQEATGRAPYRGTWADLMMDELTHRADLAGTTMTVRFVSADEYARHF